MKKKFFCLIAILFLGSFGFSQNVDMRYYKNIILDYSGYAGADFIGEAGSELEIAYDFIVGYFGSKLTEVKKITKSNAWLLDRAMNNWDYQPGEIYYAAVMENEDSESGLIFFIKIAEDKSLVWRCWLIKESDANIFETFSQDIEDELTEYMRQYFGIEQEATD